eukprot:COSAG05_NODE_440_length_9809_cov_10.743769_8_plen_118_part_00
MTSLNLFKLFVMLLFLGHVMACLWYYVGNSNEVLTDGSVVKGWVAREGWSELVSDETRYVASYFYSLTDFVSEIGMTQGERIYGVCQHLVYEAFFGTRDATNIGRRKHTHTRARARA